MASESNIDKESQDIESEHTPLNPTEEDQTTIKDTVTDKNNKESSGNKDQVTLSYPLQPKPPVVRFSSHKGDNTEQVEVIEYTDTEVMDPDSSNDSSLCKATKGPHITLMTVLLCPVAFFPSLTVAFYYGAWTWYNLYIYYSEERTMCHKIFICPLLIITFPLTVGLSSIGIAVFAAFIQISWSFIRWKIEFLDFEKGFYGWLCYKLGLPMCSPYEVIEYTDDSELEPMRT
ncbi:transmembrane protein 169-like [Saccostrea echinata]|uniref:transmembrane protein 169-like n=1 Tax=Saccostrea echinata TaxID=191078 RepID=UPI002A82CDCE|nr:transmembrane protein 169-like [Saccostrea echinata]